MYDAVADRPPFPCVERRAQGMDGSSCHTGTATPPVPGPDAGMPLRTGTEMPPGVRTMLSGRGVVLPYKIQVQKKRIHQP